MVVPKAGGLQYMPFLMNSLEAKLYQNETKINLLGLAAVLSYLCGLHSTGHLKSVWLPIKTATILAH